MYIDEDDLFYDYNSDAGIERFLRSATEAGYDISNPQGIKDAIFVLEDDICCDADVEGLYSKVADYLQRRNNK